MTSMSCVLWLLTIWMRTTQQWWFMWTMWMTIRLCLIDQLTKLKLPKKMTGTYQKGFWRFIMLLYCLMSFFLVENCFRLIILFYVFDILFSCSSFVLYFSFACFFFICLVWINCGGSWRSKRARNLGCYQNKGCKRPSPSF